MTIIKYDRETRESSAKGDFEDNNAGHDLDEDQNVLFEEHHLSQEGKKRKRS